MKGCDLQDAMDRMSVPTRVDEALMRRVCGNYATGVAIVSTMSATDQPVALTVNSFSSVSLDPPLILWSLRSTSPSRRHFEDGKAFAISILGEGQNELAMRFARAVPDKFDGVTRRPGLLGAPLIEGSIAHLECLRYHHLEAGDHIIFIWHVVEARQAPDRAPLTYYEGRFHRIAPLPGA
jgi:flavin reductase (DIM6/NTAB) family NADH-FMN oxidoreductase RutF